MHELGCKDIDTSINMGTSMSTGTIHQHKQFFKNYNKIWLIGYCYDTTTI